jgi:hypothetical protein
MSIQIDEAAAKEFLALLDLEAKAFTFQCFDDDQSAGHASNRGLARATSDWATVGDLYQRGAGVFVTVNQTDLKGRGKKNIVRIRAVWQEDDDGFTGELPLKPSIVVESSPGKFHRYLLVAGYWPADLQGIADFDAVLDRMADTYGSDKGAKGINRVLRVPGFLHRKNPAQPHMVKIVEASGARYTRDQIMRAFPPVERLLDQVTAPKVSASSKSKYDGGGAAALAGLARTVATAAVGQRNSVLNWASWKAREHVAAGDVTGAFVREVLIEAASRCGLGPDEAARTVDSGLSEGKQCQG